MQKQFKFILMCKINYQIISNILSSALSQFFNSRLIKTLSNKKLSWSVINSLKREKKTILKAEYSINFMYC